MSSDTATGVSEALSDGGHLAGDFAVLARVLQAEDGLDHTLQAICTLAVHVIDGAEHAGITVLRGRNFTTPAASDDLPALIDRIQCETRQGLCVEAVQQHEMVLANDLAHEARWPGFTARIIAATNVRSMLSYRLFVRGDVLGALNLYSSRTAAFGEAAQPLGAIFAAHAAVAMKSVLEHDRVTNLQHALASNRRIGTAIGILMSRHGILENDAFARLRTVSQSTNRKLRDVADEVVLTGDLDPAPLGLMPRLR